MELRRSGRSRRITVMNGSPRSMLTVGKRDSDRKVQRQPHVNVSSKSRPPETSRPQNRAPMPVLVERVGPVLVIELQREEKRNAIDPALTAEIDAAMNQ